MDGRPSLRIYDLIIFEVENTLRGCTVPDRHHPLRNYEWEILHGVEDAFDDLREEHYRRGLSVGLVSNYDMGGDTITESEVLAMIRSAYIEAFRKDWIPCSIAVCFSDDAVHPRRLPNTGMIDETIKRHGAMREKTLIVGDSKEIKSAALQAGVTHCDANVFFNR